MADRNTYRKTDSRRQGHRTGASVALVQPLVTDAPPPPMGLLKHARERWVTFWTSDVARAIDPASDMPRLVRWIESVNEYDRLSKVFRKSPLVKGSQGQPVLNPLAQRLQQLETQISRAEQEFGMTPLARMRLGIATGEAARSLHDLNDALVASYQDDDDDPRLDVIDGYLDEEQ